MDEWSPPHWPPVRAEAPREFLHARLQHLASSPGAREALRRIGIPPEALADAESWRVRELARAVYLLENLLARERPPLGTLPRLLEPGEPRRRAGLAGVEEEIAREERHLIGLRHLLGGGSHGH